MQRLPLFLVPLLIAASLGLRAHADDSAVTVAVGRVTVVRSAHAISTVAVGDPAIADVIAEGENSVLVFGKKFGRTDLVLMDGNHRLLRKSAILVGPSAGEDAIIVRRPDKEGIAEDFWVCMPACTRVKDK